MTDSCKKIFGSSHHSVFTWKIALRTALWVWEFEPLLFEPGVYFNIKCIGKLQGPTNEFERWCSRQASSSDQSSTVDAWRFTTKWEWKHVFVHIFMQIFRSFYNGLLKHQICYSFTLLISWMVITPFKMVVQFFKTASSFPNFNGPNVFPPNSPGPWPRLQKGRKIPGVIKCTELVH